MNSDTFYPESMKSRPNWVLWRLCEQKGKMKKVPYSASGKLASATDRSTWTDYETANSALKHSRGFFHGVGYTLDKDITFIDLDNCLSRDGRLTAFADNVLNGFRGTYAEISQSRCGVHIFCFGNLPKAIKTAKCEMYSSGRFAAMTGRAICENELKDRQPQIDTLYQFLNRGRTPPQERTRTPPAQISMTEREVVERAMNSKDGYAFTELYSGNWKPFSKDGSQSSSDFLFACKLYFWTGANRGMMESIFQQSGLFRNERKMRLAVSAAMRVGTAVYEPKQYYSHR